LESILIIDDDKELCELVGELLTEEGFRVEAASVSSAGLERALSAEFGLVVLDVMMPGLNGFEVLRRRRGSQTRAARTPVLMLTARGEDVDRIVGLVPNAPYAYTTPLSPPRTFQKAAS
jgi:two-component system, OmpR family, response regulator CpxR